MTIQKDRVQKLLDDMGWTYEEMGNVFGVSRQAVYQWWTEENSPSPIRLKLTKVTSTDERVVKFCDDMLELQVVEAVRENGSS